MKFTIKWLKEFLETDATVSEIADKLNVIGFEVEEIIDRSKELEVFEVAEIIAAEKHPAADKLQVCKVLTKNGEKQIVCGAPNARAGIKVVLAPVGALIPNGNFVIKDAEIRGVKSSGMMCSENELLISGEHAGIIELPSDAIVGEKIARYFGLDDPVVDISVTPNRGDMLGVYGIARDLAAAGLGRLKPLKLESDIKVQFSENTQSPLFAMCEVKDVDNRQSPEWLKHYLTNIGVGSISAVVDVTNYICHAFGRPMHAYDKSKLSGDLHVAMGEKGLKFMALSGKEYELTSDDLVVTDDKNIQALAGIIGGMSSACSAATTTIILESAIFNKDLVTGTGRRMGIETDSRYRFERSTDPMMVLPVLELAAKMITEICGGEIVSFRAIGMDPAKINSHKPINLTHQDIISIVGYDISLEKSRDILQSLGFAVTVEPSSLSATAPSWRHDISLKEDVIEEIVRIYGIDNIPSAEIRANPEFRLMKQSLNRLMLAKRVMAAGGFDEVLTWSFMHSKNAVNFTELGEELKLQNPISAELDYMRPSIVPNLLEVIAKNHARSCFDLKLFEVGPIFGGVNPEDEKQVVAAALSGNVRANIHEGFRAGDVFDIKSSLETLVRELGFDFSKFVLTTENLPKFLHPTRSAMVSLGKLSVGYFGEMHPSILNKYDITKSVVVFELNLSSLPEARLKYGKREDFVSSVFQPVTRDFAFVMDKKQPVGPILTFVASIDKTLIKEVNLFDVYEGDKVPEGQKSVALTVTLQSAEKTLSEEELGGIQNQIIHKVSEKFGCILRA